MPNDTAVSKIKTTLKSILPQEYRDSADRLYARVTAPYYWGNQVTCPVCQTSFRHFLPKSNDEEKQGRQRCPGCRSEARHRLLTLYLNEKNHLFFSGMKILHLAPETMIQTRFKQNEMYDYYSADLTSRLASYHFDICDIPFKDEFFDCVICNHVLEHVPDDRRAMSELLRVLKPGGWAILMVPLRLSATTYEDPSIITPEERAIHFGQWDHVRYYGSDYKERLENIGFEVLFENYKESLSPEDIHKYGLSGKQIIPFCRKPS